MTSDEAFEKRFPEDLMAEGGLPNMFRRQGWDAALESAKAETERKVLEARLVEAEWWFYESDESGQEAQRDRIADLERRLQEASR